MTTIRDLPPSATVRTAATSNESVSPSLQALEEATQKIVETVVQIAVAVSVALVTGNWDDFVQKMQDILNALHSLRSQQHLAQNLYVGTNAPKEERERADELKHRIELAMVEAAAMKKLVLKEALRRQAEVLSQKTTGFEDSPIR